MFTLFYARLLGLWILVAALSIVANRETMLSTMNALFGDPALVFVTGAFTVVIGLAIILTHNRWSGGAVTVIVTLYGWAALLKGLLLLYLPPAAQAHYLDALHFWQYFYWYLGFALAIGAYLTYEGFRPLDPGRSSNTYSEDP